MAESSIPMGHPMGEWAAQFPAQREMHRDRVSVSSSERTVGDEPVVEITGAAAVAREVIVQRPLSAAVAAHAARVVLG